MYKFKKHLYIYITENFFFFFFIWVLQPVKIISLILSRVSR